MRSYSEEMLNNYLRVKYAAEDLHKKLDTLSADATKKVHETSDKMLKDFRGAPVDKTQRPLPKELGRELARGGAFATGMYGLSHALPAIASALGTGGAAATVAPAAAPAAATAMSSLLPLLLFA